MKKFASIILILTICILAVTGQAWADADGTSKLVIKENSEIYKINSKEYKYEKPFSKQDVLMVCLEPVVKALNLTMEKGADNKTITLKYSGLTMTMQVGSNDATVDGKKTPLPQAPVSVNGSIMIPLRFVVENFGGEVSVDSKTLDIIITKESAGDNSIKDFSLLLKKTTKEIVGDSYYKWSIRLPKDVKIAYRSFNGSYNEFEAVDGSYNFSLSISDLKSGENFDTLFASELQYASDYTLMNQEKAKRNGLDYFKIVYRDSDYIYEEREFVKDNKVYGLYLEIEDEDKYKNNKELAALMDSFLPEFKKDDRTEDLSDVTADGYRIFEEKKLKFSIKVPADWYESSYDNKENQVFFTEPSKDSSGSKDSLSIYMFSKESGLTMDKLNAKELNYIKDEYNPELVKVAKSEDITINKLKAKRNVYSMKLKSKTSYICNLLVLGNNYRYDIRYETAQPYDNAAVRDKINNLLGTFTFIEPEPDEAGSLLDPESVKPEGIRHIENKDKTFSFDVPINWIKATSDDENIVSYSNDDRTISATVTSKKDVVVNDFLKYLEGDFKKTIASLGSSMNIDRQTFTDKGTLIVKYTTDITRGELAYKICYYTFSKGSTVYEAVMYIADINASEKNKKILTDIWESLKLQ